jgi:hypothetical protein
MFEQNGLKDLISNVRYFSFSFLFNNLIIIQITIAAQKKSDLERTNDSLQATLECVDKEILMQQSKLDNLNKNVFCLALNRNFNKFYLSV